MPKVSEAIRRHHQALFHTLTTQIAHLAAGRPEADPAALVTFLHTELLPHAVGEEHHLYPAIEPLLKAHGEATATMRVDHTFLEEYIRQIDHTVQKLSTAAGEERATLHHQLQRLTWQLEALLRVHLEKEERIYLPLLEQYLSAAEQQRVLEGMHAAYTASAPAEEGTKTTLDVRPLPPPQRHPLIFQTLDSLQPGESFILINDHDPKPLYYQLHHEREGQFTWEYLEQGPVVWRVRIGRTPEQKEETSCP
ncbi:MAG: DUF2249 domain-containing protein [Nitrospinota bacterium]|nr:MAG: DUF2249 domain-containing protein [Nitrospinota bacterium]